MEKYLAALLLMVTVSASAKIIQGTVPIVCADEKEFSEAIASFNEEPILTARSNRDMGGGPLVSAALVVFLNTKTGTFTIAEKVDEMYCIISMGENMKPFYSKDGQTSRKGT